MVLKEQLTLAILAGGRGERLGGRDKGQLVYRGRTLLESLMDLGALCEQTLIVRDDVVPGKGAPGGVVTALLTAKTPHVLIVCCDMPRVTSASVAPLLGPGGPAAFMLRGHLEPFPAIYPSALGPAWRARLDGDPSMNELLRSAGMTGVPLLDPDVVRSVNTADDARSLGVDIP